MKYYFYALKNKNGYDELHKYYGFYTNGLLCGKEEEVYSIVMEECLKGSHDMVGFISSNGKMLLAYPYMALLSMCFEYGVQAEVQAGRGKIIYLKVTEETLCSKAGDLKAHRAYWDLSLLKDEDSICLEFEKLLEQPGKDSYKLFYGWEIRKDGNLCFLKDNLYIPCNTKHFKIVSSDDTSFTVLLVYWGDGFEIRLAWEEALAICPQTHQDK